MVPSAIAMPRDGSFALALLGNRSMAHAPMVNSSVLQRIGGIFFVRH